MIFNSSSDHNQEIISESNGILYSSSIYNNNNTISDITDINTHLSNNFNISDLEEAMHYILFNSNISELYGNNKGKKFKFNLDSKNILVTLTTTDNKKREDDYNETSINLKECENILKNSNDIPHNDTLFISEIQIKEEGMKIPIIEYQIYDKNFKTLNISICNNKYIDISIPVKINETIEQYNPKSDYYNNICTIYTSNKHTDITLYDRRNDFINNNMTLCEEDCEFIDYDYIKEKVKCSCLVKINLPFIRDIKFDKVKLYNSFTDIKNILNLKLLQCYKVVFDKNNIKKNYGFYIFSATFNTYFICLIIFIYKLNSFFKNTIHKIIDAKKSFDKLAQKETYNENKGIINNNIQERNQNINNNNFNRKKKRSNTTKDKKRKMSNPTRRKKRRYIGEMKKNNSGSSFSKVVQKSKQNNVKNKEIISLKNILEYNDNELNSLSYIEAIQNDKRTFIRYYLSLMRKNHLIFFSFFNNNDNNSRI